MERAIEKDIVDLLGDEVLGGKSATKWVEAELDILIESNKLGRLRPKRKDFKVVRFIKDTDIEIIVGQKELGSEAVGFIACYASRKLRTLSVFADLEDKFIWTIKEGRRQKEFEIRYK